MRRKTVSGIMLSLLLLGMLTFAFSVQPAAASLPVHNINTGLDYATIQEAIDAIETLNGHTILVDLGTYYENVVVDKSISLVGRNRSTTIIDGNYSGTVVKITASNVDVTGFTLIHSGSHFRDCGVYVDQTSYNNVSHNNIINCTIGIYLGGVYSNNNTVSSNIVSSNNHTGILLKWSNNNILVSNTVSNIKWYGIALDDDCNNNVITDNIASNSAHGIGLDDSWNNTLTRNTLYSNTWGIQMHSSLNTVFHNNFINNTIQADVTSGYVNTWDDGYPSGGNYWSNYVGNDTYSGSHQNMTGSDGIGDTPYVIDADNTDGYPLMTPYPCIHAVAAENVRPGKTVLGQGFTTKIHVDIANQGHFTETFNVTVYANTTIINTLTNITLTSGNSTTITFTWNTTGVPYGNYTIHATATPVPGETDVVDNTYIDGWVLVTVPGDVNIDGIVDIYDGVLVAAAVGARLITDPQDPRFGEYWHDEACPRCPHDPHADINQDGVIDGLDLEIVENNYGKTHVPEFPSFLILPLFMILSLITVVLVKLKKKKQ